MNTKKSLLTSVASLLLCFAMLIGTTFAWFTDSVTSRNNKIVSGRLEVDLELLDDQGNWDSIKDSKEPVFDYDLWEPGFTGVKVLKVQNKGNLALKWKASIVALGDLTKLADVIDVYVKEDVTSYPQNREEVKTWSYAGTVAEFIASAETTTTGHLLAGEANTLAVALVMREDAGNEYQGLNLTEKGYLDIQIFATQYTYEEDSFDNQYDKDSQYFDPYVRNEGKFVLAGQMIIGNDIVFDNVDGTILDEDAFVDLNGFTISSNRDYVPGKNLEDVTTLVISNSKVVIDGDGAIVNNGANSAYALAITDGSHVTIKSGKYVSYYDPIFLKNGTLVVEGGFFESESDSNPSPDCSKGCCFIPDPINISNEDFADGNAHLIIKGGTFVNTDPSNMYEIWTHNQNFVADGYKVVSEVQANGDVWYTVVPE